MKKTIVICATLTLFLLFYQNNEYKVAEDEMPKIVSVVENEKIY